MKKSIAYLLNKISNFDIFSLGNSAFFYYLIIFYLMPILTLFGISIKFVPASLIIPYRALGYATLGFIFLVAGYFMKIPVLITPKIPNPLKREWDFSKTAWVFGITFAIGLSVKIIRILGGGYAHLKIADSFVQSPFYNLIGTFDWVSYIALAIAFVSYFHQKKLGIDSYKIWRFAAWGTFISEMLYAIPSCGRMQAIVPFIIYLIIRWYVWGKSFWSIVASFFIIAFLLFPLGNACRTPKALISYQPDLFKNQESTATNNLLSILTNVSINNPAGSNKLVNTFAKFATDSFLSRINQLSVLSAILKNPQPLQYGKSFKEIILVFSPPRFIWENKPLSVNAGSNGFGHRIGLLSDDDYITGVGPTIVGDWFMNFGILGIVFGMVLMGMIYRFIYEFLIKSTNYSLSGIMIYSVIWVNVIKGMEDWVAPVYAGLIKISAILFIIHFLLSKKFKKNI